jgi:hypothetical protein
MTKADWNLYINFGFQQFANPLDYTKCVEHETEEEADIRVFRYFRLHQEADEVVNEYLNSLAGEIRNAFLLTRSPLLKMSVKQIDEYVTNRLTAKVTPAQSPQSIVEPVAEDTDDDNNVEMIDNGSVKDKEVTVTGDKMATIKSVSEKTLRSPSVIRLVVRWSPKDFDTLNKS